MNQENPELTRLLALINQEQAYERDQYRLLLEEKSLNERCQQGLSLFPLQLVQQEVGLGGRAILIFESNQATDFSAFQSGKTVALFSQADQQPGRDRVTGVVRKSRSPKIEIYLNGIDEPEWLDSGKLGLDAYYDETTYREMLYAVQTLQKAERQRLITLRDILLGKRPARFLEGLNVKPVAGFNASQQEALTRVVQAEDLALIHGPPGTGKTTTMIACIQAVLEYEKRVMVTAPSNAAVDLLVLKLAEAGQKVIRLGHPARLQEAVWPHTLDVKLETHANAKVLKRMRREITELLRQARRYRRNFGPAERQERRSQFAEARRIKREMLAMEEQMIQTLLAEAEVVACTLVGASSRKLAGLDFETVFIDEAAQALEGATWIPILKARRVIMAGDHCQLPPTVHDPRAKELLRTLFEKVIERQPESGVMLNTQYRMHEDIMQYSSDYFYHNALHAAPAVAQHVLNAALPKEAPINQPLMWIDTAGCGFEEVQNPETMSYSNPEEGRLLLDWLAKLIASEEFPCEPLSIGIIAPYREQVRWLKAACDLELPENLSLEIETVDSFQGQERDMICFGFVRSNERGEIGFLEDLRRTNVAMTRARKKLVMVGDSATLSQHPFYRGLLEYIEGKDAWTSAWEFLY